MCPEMQNKRVITPSRLPLVEWNQEQGVSSIRECTVLMIVGRSVHNQRIERLYSGCVCLFYNLFYFLEDIGMLNCDNPLICMHFT